MKKFSKVAFVTFAFSLLLVSFIYGYNIGNKKAIEKPQKELAIKGTENNIIDYKNDSDVESVEKEENVIGPNTVIEYINYYKKCNDTLTQIVEPEKAIINFNEEDYKKYLETNHPDWQLLSFSSEKVIVKRELDRYCPNHYIISVKDNKIAIFKFNDMGEKVLVEIINKSVSTLKEIDQEKLKKGIVVDSEEEIGDILENFIS
ncbi:BofC C-terminal domain-containing protein [Caloranaerobacter ferrireducens]|uniref:BofC C-terminal domain-containing protein n=1 Tax=Caloranaerobacter ferrireducens TaxID=1323370 RepID=UPI00084D3098|nr:BofC C-terminal domain-containing protein [Caloranaerobacter ferrireducens]